MYPSEFGNVDSVDSDLQQPDNFILYPNYPNPFNAETTISYVLSERAFINISIYNISGQLVEVLVNQNKQPGLHSVKWKTKNQSTGLYFYQIIAGDKTATGKCLLLK